MKSSLKSIFLTGVLALIGSSQLPAAFTFNNGDLLLGFQAVSGTGSNKNVFFNLGSGVFHRNTPGNPSFAVGNISTTLASVFGSNWYSRADVYFGVIGNLNSSSPGSPFFTAPVDGDPSRTFYLSTPAITVATGQLYAPATFNSSTLGSVGTKFSGTESMVTTLITEVDGAAILTQSTQPVEWNNGWSVWNPVPGASYDALTGGIQQNFGKAGEGTYVDIQRVLATNTGASPTGVVGGGTYETTLRIGNDGSLTMVPEPSTTFLAGIAALSLVYRRRR